MSARAKSPPAATRPAPQARSGPRHPPLGGRARGTRTGGQVRALAPAGRDAARAEGAQWREASAPRGWCRSDTPRADELRVALGGGALGDATHPFGQERTCREPGPQRPADGRPATAPVAIGDVNPGAAVVLDRHPLRIPGRRMASGMDDNRRGHVYVLPAGLAHALAEVDVLEVHEVRGVEAGDSVERGSAHQHARTR